MNEQDFVKCMKAAFEDESIISLLRNALVSELKETISEMKKSLEFTGKEVDDLKQNLSEAKQEVKDLKVELKKRDDEIQQISEKTDANEQYSRRNSVRISGMRESEGENTDKLVLALCNNGMKLSPPLEMCDIDRSHRVGKKSDKARPLLVKFVSYKRKSQLMKMRGALKSVEPEPSTWVAPADPVNIDTAPEEDAAKNINIKLVPAKDRIYINDDLTKPRAQLLGACRRAVKQKTIKDAWSSDGTILVKDRKDNVFSVKNIDQLKF